jgi:hypothetical protein
MKFTTLELLGMRYEAYIHFSPQIYYKQEWIVEHQFSALMNRFFYCTLEQFFFGGDTPTPIKTFVSRPKKKKNLTVSGTHDHVLVRLTQTQLR